MPEDVKKLRVRSFREMVLNVSNRTGVPRKYTDPVIRGLRDEFLDALKNGEIFRIFDLGNYRVESTKQRKARNPRTGEMFDVPPGYRLKFKRGSAIAALTNFLQGKGEFPASLAKQKTAKVEGTRPRRGGRKSKAAPKAAPVAAGAGDNLSNLLK